MSQHHQALQYLIHRPRKKSMIKIEAMVIIRSIVTNLTISWNNYRYNSGDNEDIN